MNDITDVAPGLRSGGSLSDQEMARRLAPRTSEPPQMMAMTSDDERGHAGLHSARAMAAKSPTPLTVTEAFQELHKQQNQIKAALDRLIDDATTLRAQL